MGDISEIFTGISAIGSLLAAGCAAWSNFQAHKTMKEMTDQLDISDINSVLSLWEKYCDTDKKDILQQLIFFEAACVFYHNSWGVGENHKTKEVFPSGEIFDALFKLPIKNLLEDLEQSPVQLDKKDSAKRYNFYNLYEYAKQHYLNSDILCKTFDAAAPF